jgi:hypothetical protein
LNVAIAWTLNLGPAALTTSQQEEKTAGPFGGAPTVRHCTDGGVGLSAQFLQTC